jgi:hypothetical protein
MKVFLINGVDQQALLESLDQLLALNPELDLYVLSSKVGNLEADFFDSETGKRCHGAEAIAEFVKERMDYLKKPLSEPQNTGYEAIAEIVKGVIAAALTNDLQTPASDSTTTKQPGRH